MLQNLGPYYRLSVSLKRQPRTRQPSLALQACLAFAFAMQLADATARAGDLEVRDIKAVHRHGQTFITWKDVAESESVLAVHRLRRVAFVTSFKILCLADVHHLDLEEASQN